jgi:hypothetical protein
MKKKAKRNLKTLQAKKVSARKAAKVRGGGIVDMVQSLVNKPKRPDGTGGGNVSGGWDLTGNRVNS